MNTTHTTAPADMRADAFDTLARSLHGQLPRRRAVRLLAAVATTAVVGISGRSGAEAKSATSIPPNCIYVCCDGTCDSWKMCLKCVQWPKGTTTATLTAG